MKTQTQHTPEITGMMEVRQALGGRWIIGHTSNDAIIFYAKDEEQAKKVLALAKAAPELLEALKTWKEFWDTMPKGQMGKLSFDVGLFNDGFVKMAIAIKKAKGE